MYSATTGNTTVAQAEKLLFDLTKRLGRLTKKYL